LNGTLPNTSALLHEISPLKFTDKGNLLVKRLGKPLPPEGKEGKWEANSKVGLPGLLKCGFGSASSGPCSMARLGADEATFCVRRRQETVASLQSARLEGVMRILKAHLNIAQTRGTEDRVFPAGNK
jgi:hypothetical protein